MKYDCGTGPIAPTAGTAIPRPHGARHPEAPIRIASGREVTLMRTPELSIQVRVPQQTVIYVIVLILVLIRTLTW